MNIDNAALVSMVNNIAAMLSIYMPRILAALIIFIVGWLIARLVKGGISALMSAVFNSELVKKTPAEHFFSEADFGHRIEEVIARAAFWFVMLVVFYTTAGVLGLQSLTLLLEQLINYVPHILAAFIIFIFGVILAGVIESLVKGAVRSIDTKSALVAGKLAGYFVLSVTGLAAISELGIAREFILILFIGLVTTISLGFGLAIGLGSKDLIKDILHNWYQQKTDK